MAKNWKPCVETVEKKVCDCETGEILVARLEVATSARARAIGWIGRKAVPPESGLWLEPCNGVHTFFMRFPIDVLFLNANGEALRLTSSLPPWRICGPVRGACVTLELPAGILKARGVRQGDRFRIVSDDA